MSVRVDVMDVNTGPPLFTNLTDPVHISENQNTGAIVFQLSVRHTLSVCLSVSFPVGISMSLCVCVCVCQSLTFCLVDLIIYIYISGDSIKTF